MKMTKDLIILTVKQEIEQAVCWLIMYVPQQMNSIVTKRIWCGNWVEISKLLDDSINDSPATIDERKVWTVKQGIQFL